MLQWFRNSPKTGSAPRTRLSAELMEDRSVPSANSLFNPAPLGASTFVYVESNNPEPGHNAVLAYNRAANGELHQIGTFATGGTGQLNVPKLVGPDDGDQQVQATPDGKFLFAVNQGSDTITAFRIRTDGSLDRVGVFATGGDQPDSIGIAGTHLYVANRGNAAAGAPGTTAPSVTAFNINRDGTLSAIPHSKVTFPVGTFVTQTLVSRDNRFLFVEAATLEGTAGGNTLTPFRINADGTLTAAPGGAAGAGTNAPILLGSAVHPSLNIIYTGFTSAGQIGVFTYDETGRTNFVGTSADQGAGPCWCAVSADGRALYVANTGTDSIGVFSLADPLHPVQIEEVQLGGPRVKNGTANSPRANAFEIALDPTGKYLFAVTQSTDPSFPQGNQLHTLKIARDGTLTEPNAPVIFSKRDVPANAHPQGVEVVQLGGHGHPLFGWLDFGIDLEDRAHHRRHW
ncbi:6-phosphogluconolactonase [Gemmata sp. SH-PL17]|uniref:lactonase family protein n=1 Tax=Gemmata sp. SH-PL17 TaxID=1630693 RepID=UPI00078C6DD1|nr:beta-propeller fold lactonase family protein [Gemmata sp. SH-PL17]AMV27401.1 6-phosphogluconolactonase [Gemmata sp. SH-PL17]